jgi:two-component system LytT family response regulator
VPGLRVLIVDGEWPVRRRLRRYLAEERHVSAVVECASAREALRFIHREQSDLLFVDAELPGVRDVGRLHRAHGRPLEVVFLTARERRAVKSLDAQLPNYLRKPVERGRFRTAINRAWERFTRSAATAGTRANDRPAGRTVLGRIIVRSRGRVLALSAEECDWIEAADNYVLLHTHKGDYLVREALGALALRLDPDQFLRIHRGAIVNVYAVDEISTAHSGWQVRLRTGATIPVGRAYRSQLRRTLAM